jgi:UDP-N-acetylmuramate dehydrogenase
LIDQAGLKGTKIGDAEISHHHANFFVNHGKANASDIAQLIRMARKSVFEKFGIKLELEVKTIGFDPRELE